MDVTVKVKTKNQILASFQQTESQINLNLSIVV